MEQVPQGTREGADASCVRLSVALSSSPPRRFCRSPSWRRSRLPPELHGLVGAGEPRAGRQLGGRTRVNRADLAPLSPDGLSLYFASNRPGGFGGRDIWVSQRATRERRLGGAGEPGADDQHGVGRTSSRRSRRTATGCSSRATGPGGFGGPDLYQSYRADIHDDFGWQTPTNLGPNVNTAAAENGNGYFDNGGHPQLYFGSDGVGPRGPDLYVSNRQADGTWGPASADSGAQQPGTETGRTCARTGWRSSSTRIAREGSAASDIWTATRATSTRRGRRRSTSGDREQHAPPSSIRTCPPTAGRSSSPRIARAAPAAATCG